MTGRQAGRVTVGVNEEAASDLDALMGTGWFDLEKDAYLVAISTAIARRLEISPVSVAGTTTKFNIGTLDSDGSLKQLLRSVGDLGDADLYDVAERLAHVGLAHLKTFLVDRGATLSEVLFAELRDDDD